MEEKEIKVYGATTKKELNPDLWERKRLKDPIRKALLLIAEKFEETLEVKPDPKKIHLLGSSASYNWTANSDIDLHLIYDFDEFDTDEEILRNYFIAKKTVFNARHDINIHGLEVELYVEDINDQNKSDGIYDLMSNTWVRKPKYTKPEVNKDRVKNIVRKFMRQIDRLEDIADIQERYKRALQIKDSISNLRHEGLTIKKDNFSVENVAFKTLRQMGYIETLYEYMIEGYDQSLSIEKQIDENISSQQNRLLSDFGFETVEEFNLNGIDMLLVKMDVLHQDMFGIKYQLTLQDENQTFTSVKDQFAVVDPFKIDEASKGKFGEKIRQWNLKYDDIGLTGYDRLNVQEYKEFLESENINSIPKKVKELTILYLR